jgi:hypothetical protein
MDRGSCLPLCPEPVADGEKMIRLAFKALAIAVFGLVSIYPCLGIAQTEPDKFNESIDLTIKAAEHLCGSLSQSGNQQSFSVKGDISSQLLALLKSLGNIGISGVGTYSQESYKAWSEINLLMR